MLRENPSRNHPDWTEAMERDEARYRKRRREQVILMAVTLVAMALSIVALVLG